MKKHSFVFAAAALCASAMTVTVAASPAEAAKGVEEVVVTGRTTDLPTAIVRYDDLNLASATDRKQLDRRVSFAGRMLCGRVSFQPLDMNAPIKACHSAVKASAKPQIERLYAAIDKGERLALGDVGALTLAAK